MCPASKKWEIAWLAATHPDLYLRAVTLERTWRNGKHGEKGSCKGLGFSCSWETWGREHGFFDGSRVDHEVAAALVAELGIPSTAGTVQLTISASDAAAGGASASDVDAWPSRQGTGAAA